MKKSSNAGSSKLNPRNFVKRVLSRTTNGQSCRSGSKSSMLTTDADLVEAKTEAEGAQKHLNTMENADDKSKSSVKFQSELSLLKTQIETLQISVTQMHNDNEKKEEALAVLAKEKEQLSIDLKKQKRSNVNLKQQLEDERNFYYKEKEQYCNEMNQFKKMKQKDKDKGVALQAQVVDDQKDIVEVSENANKEISHLKNTLNQTLEANYNLSVKFLRMKNTKLSLKQQLGKMKEKHEVSMGYYKEKIEEFQRQMDNLVQEQFHKPIPPSSKKFLHLLKHNGSLIHENLQLQFEIDRLNMEIERLKLIEVRNETNNKLKLIHHNNSTDNNKNNNYNHGNQKNDNNMKKHHSNHGNSNNDSKNNKTSSTTSSVSKCPKCKLTKVDSVRTNATSTTETKSQKSRSSQTPATTYRSRNNIQVIYEKHHSRNHKNHMNSMHNVVIEEQPQSLIEKDEISKVTIHKADDACTGESSHNLINDTGKVVNSLNSSKYDLMTISNSNMTYGSVYSSATGMGQTDSKTSRMSRSAPEIVTSSKEKM